MTLLAGLCYSCLAIDWVIRQQCAHQWDRDFEIRSRPLPGPPYHDASECLCCKGIASFVNEHSIKLPVDYTVTLVKRPTMGIVCRAQGDNGTVYIGLTSDSMARSEPKSIEDVCFGCVKTSLEKCDRDHTECRLQSMDLIVADSLTYLIDVKKECLVAAPPKAQYIALSYVWGVSNDEIIQCTRDMLPLMSSHGYFCQSRGLPPAIIDAIQFTKIMGVHYLWIDRYCIVQDDALTKHQQIQAMGSIYHNAYFTIVVADHDASSSLSGLHANRKPHKKHINGCQFVLRMEHVPVTENTLWASRGWTFQEQLLSRRSIIFRGNSIIFVCGKQINYNITHETVPRNPEIDGSGMSFNQLSWPSLNFCRDVLSRFCQRHLEFPCDSLNAIAGIVQLIEPAFPGGFHFGLPEMYFDIALLWQPSDVALEDRMQLARASGKPVVDLPTWSWARWKGRLDLCFWEAGNSPLILSYYNQNVCRIQRLVDWEKLDTDSRSMGMIHNDYDTYRKHAWEALKPLPEGWSRSKLQHMDSSTAGWFGNTDSEFTHDMAKSAIFRFPIPLSNQKKVVANHNSAMPSTQIRGRAQRVFLPIWPPQEPAICVEGQRNWHRVMHSHTWLQIGVIVPHSPTLFAQVQTWEMIAISKGEFRENRVPGLAVGLSVAAFAPWEQNQMSDSEKYFRFYNVMLIRRNNGVAERIGLGRVVESAWDALDAQEEEIIIG